MTDDDRITRLLTLQEQQHLDIQDIKSTLVHHGKTIAVIDDRTQRLEPSVKDLEATKQRGMGLLAGLMFVASLFGASINKVIEKLGTIFS